MARIGNWSSLRARAHGEEELIVQCNDDIEASRTRARGGGPPALGGEKYRICQALFQVFSLNMGQLSPNILSF